MYCICVFFKGIYFLCHTFQIKDMSGGMIRKSVPVTEVDRLGLPLWTDDDKQNQQYLNCPVRRYALTCEYYWNNVRK